MDYAELKPMGSLHLILPANSAKRIVDMVDGSANAFSDDLLKKCNAIVITPAAGIMANWAPVFPLENDATIQANTNKLPSTATPTINFGHVIAGVSNFELSGTRNVRLLEMFSNTQINVTVTLLQ